MRLISFLLAELIICLPTHAWSSGISDSQLFRLCEVVPFISVEVFVQETGDFRVLSEERLRIVAERHLSRAGLLAEKGMMPMMPALRLSVVKHHEAYGARVIFKKWLRGPHPEAWMPVAVWETGWAGIAHHDAEIVESMEKGVLVFLSSYQPVQISQECHDWKVAIGVDLDIYSQE